MGKRRSEPTQSTRWTSRYRGLAALVVLVGVGVVLVWRAQAPPRIPTSDPTLSGGTVIPAVARRETRPTLAPALFVGKARVAHEVAREIPDVLDQLYCYCECDKHMGHKSLLSCYTDGHAAT